VVAYTFDPQSIDIEETKNDVDVTFSLIVKSEEMRDRIRQLRAYFEDNKDFTDAMFYTHQDGHYEVIVRNNSYLPFLLHAFRFRCIESLSWK
jgi:hypothetical protein